MGEGTFPLGMADRAMRLTEREQDAAGNRDFRPGNGGLPPGKYTQNKTAEYSTVQ